MNMKHLLAILTLCCLATGAAFADEPEEGKVYVSKEYSFGMEKHRKDCTLQIVRKGADFEMMVVAPKGRMLQVIRTIDSDGNLNYMSCVDCKLIKKDGVECNLLTFHVPEAYNDEEYFWTDVQIDGQQIPVSVARKMRIQMQKGFHAVNMKYNYDLAKRPSKIRIEEGWNSIESRFSSVPGRDF